MEIRERTGLQRAARTAPIVFNYALRLAGCSTAGFMKRKFDVSHTDENDAARVYITSYKQVGYLCFTEMGTRYRAGYNGE